MRRTADLTLTLPRPALDYIQRRIADGAFRSPSDFVESLVVEDMLGSLPPDHSLSTWMNTEGARRLRELDANPERALTPDQAFAGLLDANADKL